MALKLNIGSSKVFRKNPINPNLLTPNQATCGRALGASTGFLTLNSVGQLTYDTNVFPNGAIKVVGKVGGGENSAEAAYNALSINDGIPHTFIVQCQSDMANHFIIFLLSASDWSTIVNSGRVAATGSPQTITIHGTPKSGETTLLWIVRTDDNNGETFYIKDMILREGTY